jgi:DNA primase
MLVPPISSRKLLERATDQYEASLEGSPASLYLMNRALTKEVQTRFRLGFVESPLPGHEQYIGRLAIPYLTRSGVVDIRFRAVPPDGDPARAILGAKYLSMTGQTPRPFNTLALARQETFVVICEGELDTITADMAGLPAVGFPGVNSWQKMFWRMFRYRRVAILADNDDKGQGAKE